MEVKNIFLASSSELQSDRIAFQLLIGQLNQDWISKDYFFNLVIWENFIDAMSKTGLQKEYNKAIQKCDIFVLLFFTKVGPYTAEEFETAFGAFQSENKPIVYTYFKDDLIQTGDIGKEIISLLDFKEKLNSLGHYYTRYRSIEDLKWQFGRQLDKLFAVNNVLTLEISEKSTQSEIDTIALLAANKVLLESTNKTFLDRQKLINLISKSSEITQHTIFLLASKIRKENWQHNKDIMERTIPLFESLIACDDRKEKHYYYGQLGYALKDKRNPEWQKAKDLFDIAIDIIGYPEHYFAYYYYDFNRALCLIKTDEQFQKKEPSVDVIKEAIIKDFYTFSRGFEEHFEGILQQESNKIIIRWMYINNISFNDIKSYKKTNKKLRNRRFDEAEES